VILEIIVIVLFSLLMVLSVV